MVGRSPEPLARPASRNYEIGRFTCEAIEERRRLAAWIRAMGQLADDIL